MQVLPLTEMVPQDRSLGPTIRKKRMGAAIGKNPEAPSHPGRGGIKFVGVILETDTPSLPDGVVPPSSSPERNSTLTVERTPEESQRRKLLAKP